MVLDSVQYCIYSDHAYVLRPQVLIACAREFSTVDKLEYNQAVKAARESVKWTFKDIKQYFTAMDFSQSLRVEQGTIALLHIISTILCNFRTCMGH